jgi:hypothetical protein
VNVVNITDEELKSLRDSSGEIRFEKVFEWCYPRYGDNDEQSLFEFQAARMQNYMTKRVADGWTLKYYHYDKVITVDHVARFYGACLAKCLWEIARLNRYFVQENSSMQYHQFKHLCQRMLWRT